MPDNTVRVDLHPMHQQVLANLALLQAGSPADDTTRRAIQVLQQIDESLKTIACGGMGVNVHFK